MWDRNRCHPEGRNIVMWTQVQILAGLPSSSPPVLHDATLSPGRQPRDSLLPTPHLTRSPQPAFAHTVFPID